MTDTSIIDTFLATFITYIDSGFGMCHAEWTEIDLDGALWTTLAEKMKMCEPHHVPLSRQTVTLFQRGSGSNWPGGVCFPLCLHSRPPHK